MRLISSAIDFACTGVAFLIAAIAPLVLGFEYGSAGRVLFAFVFMTIVFGTSMYLLMQRGRVRTAVTTLAPAPELEREGRAPALRRAAVLAVVQATTLVALGFGFRAISFADAGTFGVLAGVAAGSGLMHLLAARWIRAWERANRTKLVATTPQLQWPWQRRPRVAWSSPPIVLYADVAPMPQ
jgi:hypothetical protein